MFKYKDKVYYCHFELSIDIIVGKWKPIIVHHIAESENASMRFNEIKKSIPDLSSKVLTQKLRELEEDNVIEKNIYAEVPIRVEYKLTDIGKKIIPALNTLRDWGIEYAKDCNCEESSPKVNSGKL